MRLSNVLQKKGKNHFLYTHLTPLLLLIYLHQLFTVLSLSVSLVALCSRHWCGGLADCHDDWTLGSDSPGAAGGGHPSLPCGSAVILPAHQVPPVAIRDGAGDHAGSAHVPPALPAGPRHDAAQPPLHWHRVPQHRSTQQGEEVTWGLCL